MRLIVRRWDKQENKARSEARKICDECGSDCMCGTNLCVDCIQKIRSEAKRFDKIIREWNIGQLYNHELMSAWERIIESLKSKGVEKYEK